MERGVEVAIPFQRAVTAATTSERRCIIQSAASDEKVARWRQNAVKELLRRGGSLNLDATVSTQPPRPAPTIAPPPTPPAVARHSVSIPMVERNVDSDAARLPSFIQERHPSATAPEEPSVVATPWSGLETVELHHEEQEHQEATSRQVGCIASFWWSFQGWLLAIGVGVCTSLTGVVIEKGVRFLASARIGACQMPWVAYRDCPDQMWTSWGEGLIGFAANIGLGTMMAVCSAVLVHALAPAAAGSGIPEVKTILNGFVMPEVVALRTLMVKVPGLMLSVASGMSLGKEGPLVHVAICWAQQFSELFEQYQNEGKRRELFSAAAAAGVSAAFGAPLGGVLFSLEEVSSFFPSQTLVRTFTAAMAAAITLAVVNSSDTTGLTLFSVEYNKACHPFEYLFFASLGAIGGLIGILFNFCNIRWSALRMRRGFRKRIHPLAEVTMIALITLLSSWPLLITRELSTDSIHAMFENCGDGSSKQLRGQLGLCTQDSQGHDRYAPMTANLLMMLALASLIRLLQTILTFGTAVPAGLFVPSLFIGACIGRIVGIIVQSINADQSLFPRKVEPGVYAMVGAASVLGGICRVTISLVAIMLELTGGMTYIVPFMLAILIAKQVGDLVNDGIYDLYIVLKGYPFLQEDLDVTFTERCCDIMETSLCSLEVSLGAQVGDLRWLLETHSFSGYPVVNAGHFVGYLRRQKLEELLHQLESQGRRDTDPILLEQILPFTDCTVMRMLADTPLTQAHKVFKQLGCKYIFLVGSQFRGSRDVLQGMLSKKMFLQFLKSGRVGHMADPQGRSSQQHPPRAAWVARLMKKSGRRRARSHSTSNSSSFVAEFLQPWLHNESVLEASSGGEDDDEADERQAPIQMVRRSNSTGTIAISCTHDNSI